LSSPSDDDDTDDTDKAGAKAWNYGWNAVEFIDKYLVVVDRLCPKWPLHVNNECLAMAKTCLVSKLHAHQYKSHIHLTNTCDTPASSMKHSYRLSKKWAKLFTKEMKKQWLRAREFCNGDNDGQCLHNTACQLLAPIAKAFPDDVTLSACPEVAKQVAP